MFEGDRDEREFSEGGEDPRCSYSFPSASSDPLRPFWWSRARATASSAPANQGDGCCAPHAVRMLSGCAPVGQI